MAMEWSSTSLGSGMKMLEQAKEELQILEVQHPNRFDYLKLELKSFILLLESQNLATADSISSTASATTQASSTSKKRKKCSSEMQRLMPMVVGKQKIQKGRGCVGRRDRVDVVIERAQACLHKIQQFKTSFL